MSHLLLEAILELDTTSCEDNLQTSSLPAVAHRLHDLIEVSKTLRSDAARIRQESLKIRSINQASRRAKAS
jgi:hypothetical protein